MPTVSRSGSHAPAIPGRRRRRPSRGALASLSILGVLAGLALCEILVRLVGPSLPVSFSTRALQQLHPVYGVFHRAGASAWIKDPEYTTFVRFNQDGLRGPEVAAAPRPGRARLLILGDSFVEAAEVHEDETVSAVLAGQLATRGPEVEVLNAGVRGWGNAQQYLYLIHQGLELRPDVVILVVYVGNDLVDNSAELSGYDRDGARRRPFYGIDGDRLVLTLPAIPAAPAYAPVLEAVRAHSSLLNLFETGVTAKLASDNVGEVQRSVHRLAFAAPPTPPWERSWAVTEALIAAARRATEARGAHFLLVVAPHKGQADPAEWDRLVRGAPLPAGMRWDRMLPQDRLMDLARRDGIDALDLLPAVREGQAMAPHFFARNSHWTAAGHRTVADALACAIGERLEGLTRQNGAPMAELGQARVCDVATRHIEELEVAEATARAGASGVAAPPNRILGSSTAPVPWAAPAAWARP